MSDSIAKPSSGSADWPGSSFAKRASHIVSQAGLFELVQDIAIALAEMHREMAVMHITLDRIAGHLELE